MYTLADEHHADGDEAKFAELCELLRGLSHDQALLVASAFSNLLSLHNLSEEARPYPYFYRFSMLQRALRGSNRLMDCFLSPHLHACNAATYTVAQPPKSRV